MFSTANPVSTTTCSITEAKYGQVGGAIERFKSAADLQIAAFHCFNELRDGGAHAQLGSEPLSTLSARWAAITGTEELPAALETYMSVKLRPELKDVVGTTRMYSGSLHTPTVRKLFDFMTAAQARR